MYAKITCYYLCVIFYLKNLNFWPEIAIFSALICSKIQLCKFVQVFTSYLTSGHVKVQNECKISLLFSVDHFLFEKMQFLVNFWLEIAIFSTLTLLKFKLCNFVQLLSPHPSSGHL
jgi:hypothetical protein